MVQFRAEHPEVTGMADRIKAIEGEIDGIDRMLDGRSKATSTELNGRLNNIDGLEREFALAKRTPGLTGMSRKFSLDGRPDAVEVDAVGDGGRTWIDSKSTEPFGLQSTDWTGRLS
jgi:hypothetical protein